MKNIFKLIMLVCIGLLLNACYYDAFPEVAEEDIPDIPDTQVVSFKNEIEPLFGFCAGCHNDSRDPDLREGNSYNSLFPNYVIKGDAEGSLFYQYLPGNGMHPEVGRTLTNDEIALIKAWINQGAEDN